MAKSVTKQQKKILVDVISMSVYLAYDITDYLGKPWSYWDWSAVESLRKELLKEMKQTGQDY
jgi:hypothetical protein